MAVALACACAPAPAVALEPPEPVVVDAGPLSVRVERDPFALELVDRADGDVLRSVAGGAPSPGDPRARLGPLGYSFDLRVPVVNNALLGYYAAAEVETVWFHATRVLRAERRPGGAVLELATNDPLGHRLELTVERAGDGVAAIESRIAPGSGPLAAHASLSGAAFEAAPGERYLGFGERSNAVDQTGNRVFSWAEEGPFSSGEGEPLLRPLVPDFTFPTGPTATNFPVPWLVSTRGLGVLVDQTERSAFNLRNLRGDAWQVEAETGRLRLEAYAGPRPADVLRRYSGRVGRQPRPARWMLGPWVQFHGDWPERFREQDVPTTVAQTYTHYLPCGAHVGREAEERARVERHHALGYRITTYFNPHICVDYRPVYDEAARRGLLVKNALGEPYVLSNPFTADEQVSEVDFTHPDGPAFFGRLLDEAIAAGYDGWMEDFGEYTPTDAVFHDGRRGLEMHNLYPVLYHRASTEQSGDRAPAAYIRSGFHGVQPFARAVWGGDPTEDWSCSDGLCAAVHQALSIGLSGIAWWGTDIGGFHAVVNPRTSDELNVRWLQFGAVNGIMRTQANGFSFRDNRADRSQVWSPAVLPIWRRYAKLRTQLHPYVEGAGREYRRTGLPVTRHLSLAYPNDARAVRRQTEFLFGRDLLAAPVVERGARERALYLPRGRWVDLWRAVDYDESGGGLVLGAAGTVRGGRDLTLPAPLEELPILVRAGAVIPMLPPDVDTLTDVGDPEGVVSLGDRAGKMRLLAFPRGTRSARMGPHGRLVGRERDGAWTLSIRDRRSREYRLQASLATLRRPFAPCAVELDGEPLPAGAWSHDAATGVLRARFTTEDGSLAVLGCGRSRR